MQEDQNLVKNENVLENNENVLENDEDSTNKVKRYLEKAIPKETKVKFERIYANFRSIPMSLSKKGKMRFALTATVLVVAIMSYVVLGFLDGGISSAQSLDALEVQSVLEMNDTSVAAQLSAEVTEVYVTEGDTVVKGQLLATLDDKSLQIKKIQAEASIETILGQIHGAQANENSAEAKLAQVKEGSSQEEVQQKKSQYDLAESNCQRMNILYQEGAISTADYESAVSDRDVKKAQYELLLSGAKASEVKGAVATLENATASIESLEGQLKNAQASLSEIELQLEKTKIVASTDGVLSQLNVKQGELVSSGSTAATIIDDTQPWIECSVKETDLSLVEVGQEVSIRFGAYEGKSYTGKVVSVNKSADFATKRATNESGSFDIRAYGVKVEIDKTDTPLYAGMTVFVTFIK